MTDSGRTRIAVICLCALVASTSAPASEEQENAPAANFLKASDQIYEHRLSYIQSDRALALLTVLGYSIIDLEHGFSTADFKLSDDKRPAILNPKDSKTRSLPKADLGGRKLSEVTTGEPQQRLLIVWNKKEPGELQKLLDLLRNKVDTPAKQLLIEAIVIELDRDRFRDLGFTYDASKDGSRASFLESGGITLPFVYDFTRPAAKTVFEFTASLKALVEAGEAEVLSQPSVLVLDGRQARINVGDKIPYSRVVPSNREKDGDALGTIVQSTAYLDVGIVLNLRPRASEDDTQVTSQVEIQVNSRGGTGNDTTAESGALIGPPLVLREVETFVRVANNTPFVIGGLIRTITDRNRTGIPLLSKIPGLGALFRRTRTSTSRKEVIVVITPHIIPPEDRSFSLTVARDSDYFDHFGLVLFHNVYRVRNNDVFDLDFIRESEFFQRLSEDVLTAASEFYGTLWGDPAAGCPVDIGDPKAKCGDPKCKKATNDPDPCKVDTEQSWPPVAPNDRNALARQMREVQRVEPRLLLARELSDLAGVLKAKEGELARLQSEVAALAPEAAGPRRKELEAAEQVVGLLKRVQSGLEKELAATEVEKRPAEDFIQILEGKIPGEGNLVKRMLLEIVNKKRPRKPDFASFVEEEDVTFFPMLAGDVGILDEKRLFPRLASLEDEPECDERPAWLSPEDRSTEGCRTLFLLMGTQWTPSDLPLDAPTAKTCTSWVANDEYARLLRELNTPAPGSDLTRSAILLNRCYQRGGRSTTEHLKAVLALKRVLDLNSELPLTLEGFHVGLEIAFPAEQNLRRRKHVVDRSAAKLFYETMEYYYAFEQAFRRVLLSSPMVTKVAGEQGS